MQGILEATPRPGKSWWTRPRMLGEDSAAKYLDPETKGSSPHARRRPCAMPFSPWYARPIPTCAEKTCRYGFWLYFHQAHPHMRGENVAAFNPSEVKSGPSPQARRRRRGGDSRRGASWPIPAGTEKTVYSTGELYPLQAHPRRLGEDLWLTRALRARIWPIPAGLEKTLADKERYPAKEQKIFSFRVYAIIGR